MTELDFILRDIDCSLYSPDAHSPFGSVWKDVIKEEVFIKNNPRIAKLNGNKRHFKSWVYEILEMHLCSPGSQIIVSKEADYIYLLAEAILFSSERSFRYKVYDYLESRLRYKSEERNFWYVCIKSIHPKAEAQKSDAEALVLGKIFFSNPHDNYAEIWPKRMKDILKDAKKDIEKKYDDKRLLESVSTYIQMLTQEIENRFEMPDYEMYKI